MSTSISPPSFSSSPHESMDLRQRLEGEYIPWRPTAQNVPSSNHPNGIAAATTTTHRMNDISSSSSASSSSSSSSYSFPSPSQQIDPSILPDGKRSLSGISIRAFLIGVVLGISLVATIILLVWQPTPLWRIPFFISSLCTFHFLEFWVTAQYNTRDAVVSAFLLSANGAAYNIAHGSAMLECFVSHYWLGSYNDNNKGDERGGYFATVLMLVGLAAMVVGQIVRTLAMATAGSNFNHVVQSRHREGHVLITGGIYSLLRHPSYFGFFWWGLGSQLVLQNVFCFVGYALVLYRFFNSRIKREEKFLIAFFGDDYISYKSRTPVGIPLIA